MADYVGAHPAGVDCSPPPLGLRPRGIVIDCRIEEIMEAMDRYMEREVEVPTEWLTELIGLVRNRMKE